MPIEEALVYERLLAEFYRKDIENGSASRVEKNIYKEKMEWIKELKELDKEGFKMVDADGNAWGPARKQDMEEHVNANYDYYGDFN